MADDQQSGINQPGIADFMLLASHGLRTPLTAIRWGLEMLLAQDTSGLDKLQKDIIIELHRSSREMSAILRSMILLSHIEQNKYQPEPQDVSIAQLLRDVEKEYEAWANTKSIQCKIEALTTQKVTTDASLLLSVLLHLYAACIESAAKGDTLTVTAKSIDDVVEVHFTGRFPLPKISHSASPQIVIDKIIGGTPGLLLYLAHQLSEKMHWQLQVTEDTDGYITAITLQSPSSPK